MIDKQTEQAMRLWTLAQPTVSAFIASQVHDVRQRDDLLQEVAVAILENFDRFDDSLSFNFWAIGIARNKVRNYFRNRKNKPLLFDSETVENLAAAFDGYSTNSSAPLDYLIECVSELDEKTLIQIAELTGGQYFRARNVLELQRIYQLIDQLEPAETEGNDLRVRHELFAWPLGISLLCSFLLAWLYQRRES